MADIDYRGSIPSLVDWFRDSGGSASKREADIILKRIDDLVDIFNRQIEAFDKVYTAADLYFTTNYWLKLVDQGNRTVNKSREPAVFALFKAAVDALCKSYGVSVNNLPNLLEAVFGRELGGHGQKLDRDKGLANYLSRADAAKYRIRFSRNGLAVQNPWWNKHWWESSKPVLAESSRAKPNPPDMMQPDYGGFAMSMSRELYMAPHLCTAETQRKKMHFYHSSYLAGNAVMCTGTMLIRRGRILGIRNDSGHYRPTADHVVNVLEALKMFGVPLDIIYVEVGVPNKGGGLDWHWQSGDMMLRDRGNYERMERGRQHYTDHKPMRPVGVKPR